MLGFSPVIIVIIVFLIICGIIITGIIILNNLNNKSNKKHLTSNRGQAVGQYDDIAKLADLKEKGLITQEEFEQQKKKILSHDLEENNQKNDKQPNSFTFKVVVFFVLGLIVPLWPISLPLFWYLAWKSYKAGK
ncbi:MAG: SHOCT domain-containing protein [bacterium]